MPKEGRGGDHKSHIKRDIKENIKKFIKRFPILEKHYCRGKLERQYLSSDLNIAKMSSMYNKACEPNMQCKRSFFRNVFNQNFNIGFSAPQVDVCFQCLELKGKIKREKDASTKQNLISQQKLHTSRAKAFFAHLRLKEKKTPRLNRI
ncbi:hypothetical protein QE152_g12770 [Popillia japonica]|uniref:Uncharacterized protein n=1 Tax=Popillia japonica TaxID=7064 RepID=A0AAW1LQ05_POPJA